MPKDAYLAIDIGTQSNRAALLDSRAKVIAAEQIAIELVVPHGGWAEQDPDDWWANTVTNIRALLAKVGGEYTVRAIGVCGHMHGTVAIGRDGQPLLHAVQLWCDKRCADEVDRFTAQHDPLSLLEITANAPTAAWSGFKMAWMCRNQPDVYANAWKIITPKDYINFRLTGEAATDYSEASGSYLMDARTLTWSKDVTSLLGLDIEKLPALATGSQVIGKVTVEAARSTGLTEGIPVVAGAGDMLCLLLGMGVTAPGAACDITGSSEIINFYVETPVMDPRLMNLHGAGPGWIAFGILDSGGIALKWFKDQLGEPQIERAKAAGKSPYEFLLADAAAIPAGSEGLFFLPYLNGERTLGSAYSRGVFFGLHMGHSRAHMTRALIEGVCLDMRQSIEIVRERGYPVTEISTGGGGARSDVWSQVKADIYRVPVVTVQSEESGLTGAMILASVGVGDYKSEVEAARGLIANAKRFTPDAANMAAYDRVYPVFKRLHDDMQPLFKVVAAAK
jgi:xylulokinase